MGRQHTIRISGSLPQGSLHPHRICTSARTSIHRRGHMNHIDGRWPLTRPVVSGYRAARRVSQWNHMISSQRVRTCRGFSGARGHEGHVKTQHVRNSSSRLAHCSRGQCCRPRVCRREKVAVMAGLARRRHHGGGHHGGGHMAVVMVADHFGGGGHSWWYISAAVAPSAVVGATPSQT